MNRARARALKHAASEAERIYKTQLGRLRRELAAAKGRGSGARRAEIRSQIEAARARRDETKAAIRRERAEARTDARALRQARRERTSPARSRASRKKAQRQWEHVEQSCRASLPKNEPRLFMLCKGGGWPLGARARRTGREPGELFLEDLEREHGRFIEHRHGEAGIMGGGSELHRYLSGEDDPNLDPYGDAAYLRQAQAEAEALGIDWEPPIVIVQGRGKKGRAA